MTLSVWDLQNTMPDNPLKSVQSEKIHIVSLIMKNKCVFTPDNATEEPDAFSRISHAVL